MKASVEPVNFERYRASFHIPDGAYFLSHSIGCLPMTAEQSLQSRGLQPWRTRGAVWPQWTQAVESFSEAIAELLGAPAHSVCPQANVSSALAKILYALPERKGRKRLLLSEDDFPSLGFVMAQARRVGYELQYLPRGADLLDLSVWDDALSGDVQLALITHVQSDTGARLPAERIARLCREREIFSVLDVAQSAGVIPVDLGELPADFAVGSCVKWLCGGPGGDFSMPRTRYAGSASRSTSAGFPTRTRSNSTFASFAIHPGRNDSGAVRQASGHTLSRNPAYGCYWVWESTRSADTTSVCWIL